MLTLLIAVPVGMVLMAYILVGGEEGLGRFTWTLLKHLLRVGVMLLILGLAVSQSKAQSSCELQAEADGAPSWMAGGICDLSKTADATAQMIYEALDWLGQYNIEAFLEWYYGDDLLGQEIAYYYGWYYSGL